MQKRLTFLISAPRSGSSLLATILGAHPALYVPFELHLFDPLPYLGYFDSLSPELTRRDVPYLPWQIRERIHIVVNALPDGELDYVKALRSYTDYVLSRLLERSGAEIFVDKTPFNARIIRFIAKLYPESKFVLLTRHPLASWESIMRVWKIDPGEAFDTMLSPYYDGMTWLRKNNDLDKLVVSYETFVNAPEEQLSRLSSFIGVRHIPTLIDYGDKRPSREELLTSRYFGKWAAEASDREPAFETVRTRTRPTSDRLEVWKKTLQLHPMWKNLAECVVEKLRDEDLETLCFTRASIMQELNSLA